MAGREWTTHICWITRDLFEVAIICTGNSALEAFRRLLLEVWREGCQHIQISESCGNIARILSDQMPLSAILVQRYDKPSRTLVTVAEAIVNSPLQLPHQRRVLRPADAKKFISWSRSGNVIHQAVGAHSKSALIEIADRDVLLGPLRTLDQPVGMLVLITSEGNRFDARHRQMAEALLEPFSVALENDRRVHELAALREAAEADQRSLLARFGRQELNEVVIGATEGLRPVMERVALVASADVPVLILGETGSGKEVVARSIHSRSPRATGPFIRVNCGAIPSELIDSQLFGHEKGSFTGAGDTRQGWFERADGGTLFLDEIGELPLAAQVRLLRVLQDGFIERVGGHHPIHVEVRIVAATHRDLAAMVTRREFRDDLWYRLAVFPILIPPLRERLQDIKDLAQHFAERAAVRFNLPLAMPDDQDIELLQSYAWPGNVRELGTVIDRAAILGKGRRLEIAKALGIQPSSANLSALQASSSAHQNGSLLPLNEAMKRHIEAALSLTKGRIEGERGAARMLGINPHTLRARMRKLGIPWGSFRPE